MTFYKKLSELKNNNPNKKICIIIGSPVGHSLSPLMHEIGYKSVGLENEFIFDRIEVKENELNEFVSDLKEFNKNDGLIIGITCTMPHKLNIIPYLDCLSEEAKIIGAVNTIYFNGKKYVGYNTDWFGIEQPFNERKINLKGKKVAILGAGGAARAVLYAFKKNNCEIGIFNRTLEKAVSLAVEFGCKGYSLKDDKVKNADIVINATSVGMNEDISPIDTNLLNKNQIVFDCIYKPKRTRLLIDAENVGASVIYGWEMLLYQGVKQFEIYTGKKPNTEKMKEVVCG
ncbi:MAG: shikimate dehydrogenase [Rickettsiales bacterium]|nr:shikimate dehydrogenase [Rickettsiales bacterium]